MYVPGTVDGRNQNSDSKQNPFRKSSSFPKTCEDFTVLSTLHKTCTSIAFTVG